MGSIMGPVPNPTKCQYTSKQNASELRDILITKALNNEYA